MTESARETHSGLVVLLGERAYKFKKPVSLGFLDFRTLASRTSACRREFELNRRFAPDVYVDVAAITTSHGQAEEPAVVMRRMPDERRLATLLDGPDDVRRELTEVARLVAAFHAGARRGPDIDLEAGSAGLRRRWADNLRETRRFGSGLLAGAAHDEVESLALRYLDGREPMFAQRIADGLAVDGHGDLTAEDIFCLPDGPRVLDCIDFDDRLRFVDPLDDIAFLAMDIERLGHPAQARYLLERYTEFTGRPAPPSLRHHYVAYRAFVRAKVLAIRAEQQGRDRSDEVDRHVALTLAHLRAADVRLVLVGGAPGTGKTTLARRLADDTGWAHISTDDLRAELGSTAYDDAAKDRVYAAVLDRAAVALEHGESVVADATWAAPAHRDAATRLAARTSSTLVELECRLPADLAAARAECRLASGRSTSAAGAAVARQLAAARPPWPTAVGIDTSGSLEDALAAAHAAAGHDDVD